MIDITEMKVEELLEVEGREGVILKCALGSPPWAIIVVSDNEVNVLMIQGDTRDAILTAAKDKLQDLDARQDTV